ncbi:hypothetical protein D3C72_1916640 [compost metagenome]
MLAVIDVPPAARPWTSLSEAKFSRELIGRVSCVKTTPRPSCAKERVTSRELVVRSMAPPPCVAARA